MSFGLFLRHVALAASCLAAACATDTVKAPVEQSAQAEIARRPDWYTNGESRSFLVSRDGEARGVLWGTIHVAYGGDTVLPSSMRRYFDDASDLTVEFALDRMSKLELSAFKNDVVAAVRKPDPSAVATLDAPTRKAIGDLPGDQASRLSLLGLSYALSAQITAAPAGPLPQSGFVDFNLMQFARQLAIPVFNLERLAVQETLFFGEPNGPDAASELRMLVRRRESVPAFQSWVMTTYGEGRIAVAVAGLEGWLADQDDLARIDRQHQARLTDRNVAWAGRLDARLGLPGLHFFAFGAAHLLGNDGVVALLRQRGWTVTSCPRDMCPALVRI